MRTRRTVSKFACAGICLSVGLANAAQVSTEQNSKPDTVVVIGATPLPGADTDASKVAGAVQTATSEDIERTHAMDAASFINRAVGSVYINEIQNNPLQPDVNYRGFTASPLLGTPQGLSVYVDGVRMNQSFGDIVSWDLIPRAAISSLTLMPGSNPIFGLNSLGGALSIRTKDGWRDPGTAIRIATGSFGFRQVEVETGDHTDRGWYWYATGNKLKNEGWRDNSSTDAAQAFAKIGWRDAATDLFLSGAFASTELYGNGLQEQRLLAQDYASIYTKPDITRNHASLVNLVVRRALNENVTVSGNIYYRNIETRTLNGDVNDGSLGENIYQPTAAERDALIAAGYTDVPASGETAANTPFPSWRCIANILLNSEPNQNCDGLLNRTRTSQHENGAAAQLTFKNSFSQHDNQLTMGAVYGRSDAHFTQSAQFGYVTPDRGIATADGPGAFADGTQDSGTAFDTRVELSGATTKTSMYVLDTLSLLAQLDLTLSGRYDRTDVSNVDALTPSGAGSLSGEHHYDRFNPSGSLSFTLAPDVTTYISYSEGSRAPSAIELGCADPQNPCKLPNAMGGDPPLDQVITKTIEIGAHARGLWFTWSVDAFRATSKRDILFVADNAAGFGYFKNFGETRRQGFELESKSTFGTFEVGAHYTYLDATYQSDEVVVANGNSSNDAVAPGFEGNIVIRSGDRIPLVPQHLFKSFLQWSPLNAWSFDMDMVLVGESYARGNENNAHQADGIYYLGPGKIGGYTIFNLGIDYRSTKHLKLYAQFDNVLDRRYYTAAQLGVTAFEPNGSFVARPFANPVINGERLLQYSTFYAPGATRSIQIGARYNF